MSTKSNDLSSGLHKGHRERMRQRFIKSGFDGFSDHEILEFLLFYSRRQVNTNEIAHRLMNRFRSLSGVLNARVSELMEVEGIGETSAMLLSLMPELFGRYNSDPNKCGADRYDEEKIKNYLLTQYMGETDEYPMLLLFNGNMNLIMNIRLPHGTSDHCDLDLSLIAGYIFQYRADAFVLAHNHPNGSTKPSSGDINITTRINNVFLMFGKYFIDHYIVADNKVSGIKNAYLY